MNPTTTYHQNHVLSSLLTADQLGIHIHIVKDTVTFYLVVYGGLAVANTVRLCVAFKVPVQFGMCCCFSFFFPGYRGIGQSEGCLAT